MIAINFDFQDILFYIKKEIKKLKKLANFLIFIIYLSK